MIHFSGRRGVEGREVRIKFRIRTPLATTLGSHYKPFTFHTLWNNAQQKTKTK